MKPKYRRITKFLPAIISISMAASSNAATFLVDTAGNGTPAAINNGTTTIIADGGAGPQDPTPTLTIDGTINMTGEAGKDVIVVSGPNAYTINIAAGGVIAAGNPFHYGIRIETPPSATTINNSGTVSGTADSINFEGSGGVVNNLLGGRITGTLIGIRSDGQLTVVNDGFITGTNGDGIFTLTGDDAIITNNVGAIISGGEDGIDIKDNGTVNNNGTITATQNGILAINNAIINNNTNFDGVGNAISGGTITGTSNGILLDDNANIKNFALSTITGGGDGIDALSDLTVLNEFGATIEGLAGNGINATDLGAEDAEIENNGLIRGATNGIIANDGLIVRNLLRGVITGTNGAGVQGGDDADITNAGTITGVVGIDAVTAAGVKLTNSGIISSSVLGGVAIDGGTGVDTLNLNLGSRVIGNVELNAGVDTITFNGGLTSFLASASGVSSNSILGNVTGVQVINKEGTGTAFIGVPGNGGFIVEADEINISTIDPTMLGGLYINADIDGVINPQTTINANGAALGGTGTWDANINITRGGFSAGAIPINLTDTPSDAVGGVTITGNVLHTADSFIRFDVTPQGGASDVITQTGGLNTYNLGAGTDFRISATDNNRVISDGVYTIVDSVNAILGTVGTTSVQFNGNVNGNDTGFKGTEIGNMNPVITTVLTRFFTEVAKNGSNVELTVDHDYEGLGLNSNQASLGAALDASTNTVELQDFISALDYSNLETVQAVLGQLSTLDSFSTAAAIGSSNYQTNRVVQDHLAMTRAQTGTISRTYVGSYAEPAPAPAAAMGNSFNVWGSASYDWKDSSGFANDIDGEDASFVAGIDYRIAPNFLLGILLEGSTADYDFSGGSSDVDSFRAAIYGTYGEATGFYADFLVGYGDHSLDSSRSGILGKFDTDTDAESIQALLTVGYTMESGCVKHGPFAGAEYSKVDVDGYTQGGILPIAVDNYDVESTRLLIGYRAEAEYGHFTPYASVAYAHELDGDSNSTNATLPGGATFGIDGGQLDSAFLISVGTGYSINESLGLNFGYHGEISTGDGIDSHGATIGLNYAF